jgi:hypothetical protein
MFAADVLSDLSVNNDPVGQEVELGIDQEDGALHKCGFVGRKMH